MATFIYYFGAVAFAGAVSRLCLAIIQYLEKGKKDGTTHSI